MKALDYPLNETKKKDLGRMNFFLVNQTNFFIKDFLKINILENCIFVLLVDLDNHSKIKESIQRWINFIERELEKFLREIPLEDRKDILEQFKMINEKLRSTQFSSKIRFALGLLVKGFKGYKRLD